MKTVLLIFAMLAAASPPALAGYELRCTSATKWMFGPYDTATECTDMVARLRQDCRDIPAAIARLGRGWARDLARDGLPDLCRDKAFDCGCTREAEAITP
jgi:hypothetical protein